MKTDSKIRIKELVERLGRVNAADEWNSELNPTQSAALSYLARANRFSRSPSQVAEFLTATRGTVSQTLKALARKGLISETRSAEDKRSISYSITEKGMEHFRKIGAIEHAAAQLEYTESATLILGLEALVHNALEQRGYRAFGVCKTCMHHHIRTNGGYCKLLGEPLASAEAEQICFEHAHMEKGV